MVDMKVILEENYRLIFGDKKNRIIVEVSNIIYQDLIISVTDRPYFLWSAHCASHFSIWLD